MSMVIKNIMLFLMWRPFRTIIHSLPTPVTAAVGKAGGYVLYLISREKREIMAEEFRMIFPQTEPKEILKYVKGAFINYCISEIEVLLYPKMTRAKMEDMVDIQGGGHLDEALSKGKGALLFQAHFGAFQMVMPAIGYTGYTMNQISASAAVWKRKHSSRLQNKSIDMKSEYEYKLPVRHISVASTLMPVFRALKRNEVVGVTIDGGGGRKTITTRFLGRTANFSQGAVDMAIRTGAEVVPAIIVTKRGLKHELNLHAALTVCPAMKREKQMKSMLDDFIRILEPYIYRRPDHYGYTLYLRRSRAMVDEYPFFNDYGKEKDEEA